MIKYTVNRPSVVVNYTLKLLIPSTDRQMSDKHITLAEKASLRLYIYPVRNVSYLLSL